MQFKIPYNYYRFMGITGLFLIGYIVLVGIFGNTDISPYLPMQLATSIETHWPELPFFAVQKRPMDDGKGEEVYFTVPTRQLTPQEIAALEKVRPVAKTEKSSSTKPRDTAKH